MTVKNVITAFAIAIFCFALFFFSASFIELTTDIRKWDKVVRSFIGIFGLFSSVVAGVAYILYNSNSKINKP